MHQYQITPNLSTYLDSYAGCSGGRVCVCGGDLKTGDDPNPQLVIRKQRNLMNGQYETELCRRMHSINTPDIVYEDYEKDQSFIVVRG